TRAGSQDQGDLGDHTGGMDVAAEDVGVETEPHHALLDAGASRVVDADEGAADLHRHVHDLDDLLAEHLAQGPAEHREVLGEDADLPAVDGAEADDDTVAERTVLVLAEGRRPVAGELVDLDERTLVQQQPDPLARGQLASGVLLGDRPGRPGVHGLVGAPDQLSELACGRVDIGAGQGQAFGKYISHGAQPSLRAVPPTLDAHCVEAALITPHSPWQVVDVHASLDSTNLEALRATHPWRVVVADHQSAGRGRMSRQWQAPAGASIAVSCVVPMPAG